MLNYILLQQTLSYSDELAIERTIWIMFIFGIFIGISLGIIISWFYRRFKLVKK